MDKKLSALAGAILAAATAGAQARLPGRPDPRRPVTPRRNHRLPGRPELRRKADRNRDGRVDPGERRKALEVLEDRRLGTQKAAPYLDLKRLGAWLEAHPEAAKKFRARADLNGDGRVDPMERRRFYQALRARLRKKGERPDYGNHLSYRHIRGEIGPWADRNHDGKIDSRERAMALRSLVRKSHGPRGSRNLPGVDPRHPLGKLRSAGKTLGRAAALPGKKALRVGRALGRAAGKAVPKPRRPRPPRRRLDRNEDGKVDRLERRRRGPVPPPRGRERGRRFYRR